MDVGQALLLAVALCILILAFLARQKRGKLPPGPFDWPIVGSLPQLYLADPDLPPRAFAQLARKHGNVMWIRMGSLNAVVLSGFETIKAALTETEDFLNKFDVEWVLDHGFQPPKGILRSRMEFWKPTRRFTMRHLKAFGFGKKQTMQRFVNEEFDGIDSQVERAIEEQGGVLAPIKLFQLPSLNLAWASAAGFRFEHDDPKIKKLLELNTELFQAIRIDDLSEAFPILKKIWPSKFNYNDIYRCKHTIEDFVKGLVRNIKDKGGYRIEAQSFVDVFLKTMESPDGAESAEIFTEGNLVTTLHDLFFAAGDTTSGTMAWAVLWITLNPQVQEKFHQEIVKGVGMNRLPQLTDQANLPYVRATILEIHRRSVVAPLLPHKVYRDVEFQGYHIPKNTLAIINLYSSQMDPDLWGDPENFRPERFLDSDGKIVNEHKLMTFSIGKRNCVGEGVAEAAIFSFLTGLIQRFKLLPVDPGHKYEIKPVPGGNLVPHHYEIKVEKR